MMLGSCSSCSGFLPPSAARCPHCGHAEAPASARAGLDRGVVGSLVALATGGAAAVTLMACYGLPPCENTQSCGTGAGGTSSAGTGGMGGMSSTTTSMSTTSTGGTGGMGSTGSTGGAGGQAPACTHCDEQLVTPGLDPSKLCASSKTLYTAFLTCACQQGGGCFQQCAQDSRCTNVAGTTLASCTGCLTANSPCVGAASACANDH